MQRAWRKKGEDVVVHLIRTASIAIRCISLSSYFSTKERNISYGANTNPKPFHDMRSRLFRLASLRSSSIASLWILPAPCQTKKSIDLICHVITWDWYNVLLRF
ncbi:hypothetical protein RY831_29910 [Noviherbaspirillum sp. CPCC 100848]|uniref:Uncharacterized protein n=1 Tax=Noviherbaspirillum album TaxID=3080276 RepID=A0ABU6JI50_9BURK|nr:hypothetical protein [Noviherbaspirillum sp. CPCC 100848]